MATKTTSTETAKTREIAKADDGPKPMSAAAARNLTEKIRTERGNSIRHAVEAFTKHIWLSLKDTEGKPYKGWKDYSDNELGGFQISVSRQDRPAIVAELYDLGASQSIIASITGTTQQTVSNDIKWVESQRVQVTNNLLPAADNTTKTEPPTEELSPLDTTEVPLPINGETPAVSTTSITMDNKEYTRGAAPRQQKAKDADAAKAAEKIAKTLDTAASLIDALFDMPGARESANVDLILGKPVDNLMNAMTANGLIPVRATV